MKLNDVNGILLDMDGVIRIGPTPVPGAAEVVSELARRGIPYRVLTNTSTRSRQTLSSELQEMGIGVRAGAIFTTHEVAASLLRARGNPTCHLLVRDEVKYAYDDLPVCDDRPDCIVIGDIGDRWNYALVDRVFNFVRQGADMIALHKGRYWQTETGLQVDIGAFVAGLEYATGKSATVVGKPSESFFRAALDDMGVDPAGTIMVGDDIESDIGGAQQAGIRGILVKTGKYRRDDIERSSVTPDAVIGSIADLLGCI